MKVNFSDFTKKRAVHNYILDNSVKKVVKTESRLLDENGVVTEHSQDFIENCGDVKYYFQNDEILEINRINSVAIFIKGNNNRILLDSNETDDFEEEFIQMLNSELGLNFELEFLYFQKNLTGHLTTDKLKKLNKDLDLLTKEYGLKISN
ncbi:hypothetical protein EW093_03285 [Thiospirochaeta perfilievii]|uniref:Uncharacterized protein n=1 Tax=Thiospirochaeta perfilievii TaxID=252967 RepID=A0A5C1QC18_9SPIO|nr:hypothetical protein [Thiospirochaeta perfilievii]QEN03762.1 hypothetical protein EW093_03285 [Thiospirochaeta perfilievii]